MTITMTMTTVPVRDFYCPAGQYLNNPHRRTKWRWGYGINKQMRPVGR
ncbi:hypothetical protein [Sodaliphilus sp.]